MVELVDITTDTCVVAHFGGKIIGEEYKIFLDAMDERLASHDQINMVADLAELEFYGDFESFKEDWHFGTHEYRHVRRAAMVGDQKWIELFIKISKPFYKAEEKHFQAGQLEEAFTWACQD
jgi:hypothetical protein